MFEAIRKVILSLLRVPAEPEAPLGDPASVRVFRASRRLYWLRLIRWAFAQAGALAGIIFWMALIALSEHEAARVRANPQASALSNLPSGRNQIFVQPLSKVPPSLFLWLWVAKGVGLTLYLSQLAITYLAVRLDYELRWYIVTDRSLRIRFGLWKVQELTMSYANLQQVVLSQGPLERLLHIANVRVQSAGGAHGSRDGEDHGKGAHAAVFEGVENAESIRDLILERLRTFRDAGLGDPDDVHAPAVPSGDAGAAPAEALAAAQGLLDEARNCRAAFAARKDRSQIPTAVARNVRID